MKNKFIFLLLISFASFSIFCDPAVNISGIVIYESDKQPASGIAVYVRKNDNCFFNDCSYEAKVITDKNGFFYFYQLGLKEAYIEINEEGFELIKKSGYKSPKIYENERFKLICTTDSQNEHCKNQ